MCAKVGRPQLGLHSNFNVQTWDKSVKQIVQIKRDHNDIHMKHQVTISL